MIGQISTLLQVAYQSLRYRMSGVLLTILSVALSVFVLLGVEHVRQETRSGFASTVSGVDLIVVISFSYRQRDSQCYMGCS